MSSLFYNGKFDVSSLLSLFLRMVFLFTIITFSVSETNKGGCKGPIRFYKELKCKEITEKSSSCPSHYDCDHLYKHSNNKCYIGKKSFKINQKYISTDKRSHCDINCTCILDRASGMSHFKCDTPECFRMPLQLSRGCYSVPRKGVCCVEDDVCNLTPNTAKCSVDGKTYYEKQEFNPTKKPEFKCVCKKGFKGKFIPPFCKKETCGFELRHSIKIRKKCAPVFQLDMNPATSCAFQFRCPNGKDFIVKPSSTKRDLQPNRATCKFGKLTMNVNDNLNIVTDNSGSCVKCVCELPPTPTCQIYESANCTKSDKA